jgi:uncharacterized damage-inducible protein DinB
MDFQKELVAEFDREMVTTRKMLNAIPDSADLAWKANPKSMSLGRLASHVAEIPGEWGRETLAKDAMNYEGGTPPWTAASKAELLERFDKETAETRALLAGYDPAKWESHWKMTSGDQTWIDSPRHEVFRTWVMNHLIHHRAQLGRDLRTLGVPIPGCYGPSADEM